MNSNCTSHLQGNYPPGPHTLAKLCKLLRILKASPLAGRIRVFGSYVTDKPLPKDLDIVIDFDDMPAQQVLRMPGEIRTEVHRILTLSSDAYRRKRVASPNGFYVQGRYYGLLDVFLKTQEALFVRDDLGNRFIRARMARAIWRSATSGMPISEVAEKIIDQNLSSEKI